VIFGFDCKLLTINEKDIHMSKEQHALGHIATGVENILLGTLKVLPNVLSLAGQASQKIGEAAETTIVKTEQMVRESARVQTDPKLKAMMNDPRFQELYKEYNNAK